MANTQSPLASIVLFILFLPSIYPLSEGASLSKYEQAKYIYSPALTIVLANVIKIKPQGNETEMQLRGYIRCRGTSSNNHTQKKA